MQKRASAFLFLAGVMVAGVCFSGEPETISAPQPPGSVAPAQETVRVAPAPQPQPPVAAVPAQEPIPLDPTQPQPSNWEKFKDGMKQAGGAVASGAGNVADKTGDAVVRGAKKTGEFFSDGYQSTKEYIHEKTE